MQAPEAEPETPENEPKITARVMLLSTVKPEEPEDDKKKAPPPHLTKRIKFLVAKKANGVLGAINIALWFTNSYVSPLLYIRPR